MTDILLKITNMILILATTVACGHSRGRTIDPELAPYLAEFSSQASAHGRPVVMLSAAVFVPHLEGRTGECERGPIQGIVVIARDYWDSQDEPHRKVLVFHELGHCVLGREHLNTRYKPNPNSSYQAPVSIMFSTPDSVVADFEINEEYYLNELFNGH